MNQLLAKVKSVEPITHDVLRITTEKPSGYTFIPGQAAEISINKTGWKNEKRPFTFTGLPENDSLEFTIKTYPLHKGVTNQLLHLKSEDTLILHDVFGAIHYQGPGIFIAGGAGVTPFISIFRDLASKDALGNNKLIFANKTQADIILENEFKKLLHQNFINILSDEKVEGYAYGQITESFIEANQDEKNRTFYLCGPPPMMDSIEKQLTHLYGAKKTIIKEAF
jgi:ferredoxin-NADP reductase